MEGISPRCGIEQIREGGIDSLAHSQSEQYLIGERFVPLICSGTLLPSTKAYKA